MRDIPEGWKLDSVEFSSTGEFLLETYVSPTGIKYTVGYDTTDYLDD